MPAAASATSADPAGPAARCYAVVPCAGSGIRAGTTLAKQYVAVDGRPVVSHALHALAGVDRLERIVVVIAAADRDFDCLVELPSARFARVPHGAATRARTVAAGLVELRRLGAGADDWVLVHDAARCLVRASAIDALIDACLGDAVGGLLASPVADTLKRSAGGRVAATVPRGDLWQAQTPQMFRLGVLAGALERAGPDVTDEAGAIEALGLAPRLVAGPADNLKVTVAADFALADAVLRGRRQLAAAEATSP